MVAICLLGTISILLVPLVTSCFVLVLDSPISLGQGAHISRAVRFLLLTCLLFQVIAAPLFHEREPRKTNSLFVILKFLLLLVACVAGSFLSGVAASMVAGERWMRLALLPFRLIIIVPGISQKTRSRPSCAIMHNRSTPENYDTKPIFLLMHC